VSAERHRAVHALRFSTTVGQGPQSGGGVAFMAHIGGFIAGVALVRLFTIGGSRPARA
jgi:membrane associated rhomboid family serine protease